MGFRVFLCSLLVSQGHSDLQIFFLQRKSREGRLSVGDMLNFSYIRLCTKSASLQIQDVDEDESATMKSSAKAFGSLIWSYPGVCS